MICEARCRTLVALWINSHKGSVRRAALRIEAVLHSKDLDAWKRETGESATQLLGAPEPRRIRHQNGVKSPAMASARILKKAGWFPIAAPEMAFALVVPHDSPALGLCGPSS